MKKLCFFILISTLLSCSQNAEEKKTETTQPTVQEGATVLADTLKNIAEVTDTSRVVLFGRGSEPGWLCEFYGNRIRFIFNYGSDSVIVRGLNFSYYMQNPAYFNDLKVESRNKDTVFATQPVPCKEESTGEMKPLKMTIKLGKKEFSGCAWTSR
jgi:hypothetical protein